MRILKPFARQMTTIGHHKPPSIDAVNIKYVHTDIYDMMPKTYQKLMKNFVQHIYWWYTQ